MTSLSQLMKRRRLEQGLSVSEVLYDLNLALSSDYSPFEFTRWEAGRVFPPLKVVEFVTRYYPIAADEILFCYSCLAHESELPKILPVGGVGQLSGKIIGKLLQRHRRERSLSHEATSKALREKKVFLSERTLQRIEDGEIQRTSLRSLAHLAELFQIEHVFTELMNDVSSSMALAGELKCYQNLAHAYYNHMADH